MVTVCTTAFYVLKLEILPTEYVCMFHMDLTINSDFSPKQHYGVDLCSGDVTCFL
jgi:hypothetical protein